MAEEGEGVLTADDEEDGEQLQVGDQVTDVPEEEPSESTTNLHLTLKILLLHIFLTERFVPRLQVSL